MNKVEGLLFYQVVKNIIGQSQTTVNFRAAMDEGRAILVRIPKDIGEEPVHFIGAVMLGQLLNAAYSRQELPEAERKQFHIYADEYQRFATGFSVSLLTECGKFGIGTCVAHQMRGQFVDPRDPNLGATLNTASLIVFQVIGKDADELADQFDHTPPPPEVVGQVEQQTIIQDPIHHLLHKGHRNNRIRELTVSFLQDSRGDDMNAYFVDLMLGKLSFGSAEGLSSVLPVLPC